MVVSKVVLAMYGRLACVEIAGQTDMIRVDMQRVSAFFIRCECSAIHTLISLDVDVFVRSTGFCRGRCVCNDVKVFKRGSQVICVYGAICVVSASSSPVSRVISEPKEVGSFDEVGLPIWGITADGLVVIVKHDVLLQRKQN